VDTPAPWDTERAQLLGRRISELGLAVSGSRVERLITRLYGELASRGIAFRPPVYLSDQWGCPDGTPLIGVPFYLADERLERIEAEHAGAIEGDEEAMRYLRHEAGHALNYATLFIAGIVVPGLLRSDVATKEALAGGSLHTINVAGVVLSYTNQSVEFAILGSLVGAMAAFAIPFPATAPKNSTSTRATALRAALRH